ncbi:MAG: FKBP-type peptidyl-prolyl cis-trans isomerase [Saprospiraceae bacterium]|jgi:FKBP-type peptidyl-prolyl cis-trans isomerase
MKTTTILKVIKSGHFFALCLVTLFSCSNSESYQKTPNGISWKLERFSDSKKQVQVSSLVQFEWVVLDDKDQELYRDRLFLRIDSKHSKKGIFEALLQLKEGERGLFFIKNMNLEKDILKHLTSSDIDIALEGELKHQLSVDRIYNQEEFLNKRKEFLGWVSEQKPVNFNSIENQVIEHYIDNEEMKMKVSETGLCYQIFHDQPSTTTGFGKHVKIRYHGGVLSKSNNHITTTQDFYIGQELQVIKAIEEVLLLMENGDSATIIAPSPLAFGEKGSSTGLIPGASPVFYGIRILECE